MLWRMYKDEMFVYGKDFIVDRHEQFRTAAEMILAASGDDPQREGLIATPERVARSYEYLLRGYNQKLEDVVNGAIFQAESDDMVIVRDIEFYSLCEHHMLPFFGVCHVGYIPTDRILGVSKIARIVDMFARRLQIQERLTQQISEAIMEITGAEGVGVYVNKLKKELSDAMEMTGCAALSDIDWTKVCYE